MSPDGLYRSRVDGGEGLEVALGMPRGNANARRGMLREISLTAGKSFARFAVAVDLEVVGILLAPQNSTLRGLHP